MRYNFDNGVMFAAIDGRWVKWEDHAKIVKELAHETKSHVQFFLTLCGKSEYRTNYTH